VWDDNNAFLNERQLNSADFFKFFEETIGNEDPQKLVEEGEDEEIQRLYYITKKMIFNLLVYSDTNSSIKDVGTILRQILQASDECCKDFTEMLTGANCEEMIRILLKCPDEAARDCVCDVLSTAVNRLFVIEEESLGKTEKVEEMSE